MQQANQSDVSQIEQKKLKINYLYLGTTVLVCFVVFGTIGYYLGNSGVVKKTATPTVTSPISTVTNKVPSVATPVNEKNDNSNLKTYNNAQYQLAFDYPQNYIISTNPNCSNLKNNQKGCLLSLNLNPTNIDFPPKAYFWLLQGVTTVNIPGQVSIINFDSQKKAWVLNNSVPPAEVLPVWNYTKSGKEIIKSSNGGSYGSSYYYIIPNYNKDEVAVFSVPESYRLRCDNFLNDKPKETDCNNFYKSVIDQYNKGKETVDAWLPKNYLISIYSEAENIVKSYRETAK